MMESKTNIDNAFAESPVKIHIDSTCGLIEVGVLNSALQCDALHISYFLDRSIDARWGEVVGETLVKSQALERLRAASGFGDAQEEVSDQERKTLERLVATPIWDSATCLASILAKEAMRNDGFRPKGIVELGAGLGLPGFLAARLWSHSSVAVTESGDSLTNLLRRNFCANFSRSSSGEKRLRSSRTLVTCDLSFGSQATEAALAGPLQKFRDTTDLVIVSDCFFYPWYGDTWSPLRESLLTLCNDTTLVLVGTKHRDRGRVAEAMDHISKAPFYQRLLLQSDGCCEVCNGEGFIDSTYCFACEGTDTKDERKEVWLLSKSESALQHWMSSSMS